jgi:hemolysin III
MLASAVSTGSKIHVITTAVYGASLIILYSSSTLYHSFRSVRLKKLFNIFDHISIYYLIAGTYTPILVEAGGTAGILLLVLQWSTALAGTALKIFFAERFKLLSTLMYLAMGWMFVFEYESLASSLPQELLVYIIAGGVCYSVGVIFFLWEKLRFSHVIWHLFVLAGSIMHFFGIYFYILP